jgi:FMN phosphatase YigB (HAD superfamily)
VGRPGPVPDRPPGTTTFTTPSPYHSTVAVSFDLFGTLVDADRPADPAEAVADELRARDVPVPDDWAEAYREPQIDAPAGAEVPLPAHVAAALRSRGVSARDNAARRAVVAAFDPAVETCDGAVAAVQAAHERGPVALCSNCAVPELVGRTLIRSALSRDDFDAVVTSVGCGWRKPDRRAFEACADALGVDLAALVHVGDDPATDGGADDAGATFLDVADVPLPDLPDWLEDRA